MGNDICRPTIRRKLNLDGIVAEGSSSPGSSWLSPQKVCNAYGINLLSATGAGQTIAIIDAGDNPNLVSSTNAGYSTSNLYYFNDYFGLTQFGTSGGPYFLKLDENGGTSYPASGTSSWPLEESLDVEWAHAIAPGANIILIEANSASYSDLMVSAISTAVSMITGFNITNVGSGYTTATVTITDSGTGTGATAQANIVGGQITSITLLTAGKNYTNSTVHVAITGDGSNAVATAILGVSSVSMSFSGTDGFLDTAYDSYFTTPSGHTPITFLAATGDTGAPPGYPATSPNVVAVGGTSLILSNGNYSSETGWNGSSGGLSSAELQPNYQNGLVIHSGINVVNNPGSYRSVPDVAFVADPNTGVAVYDAFSESSGAPWIQVGGTSLSTPCWAGLIALANQIRVSSGLTTLDGPTQTLPALYSLYSS